MFLDGTAAFFIQVDKRNFFIAGAVQDTFTRYFIQRFEWRVDIEFVVGRQAGQQGVRKGVAPVPSGYGATGQAQFGESHDAFGVEKINVAQAVAARAGPDRIVETEQARLELSKAVAAYRAGVAAGKRDFFVGVHIQRHDTAVGNRQRRFKTFGQALPTFRFHAQAVYHDINAVLLGFLQGFKTVDLYHVTVNAQTHKALRLQAGAFVFETAFAGPRQRSQNGQAGSRCPVHDLVDHLAHALCL